MSAINSSIPEIDDSNNPRFSLMLARRRRIMRRHGTIFADYRSKLSVRKIAETLGIRMAKLYGDAPFQPDSDIPADFVLKSEFSSRKIPVRLMEGGFDHLTQIVLGRDQLAKTEPDNRRFAEEFLSGRNGKLGVLQDCHAYTFEDKVAAIQALDRTTQSMAWFDSTWLPRSPVLHFGPRWSFPTHDYFQRPDNLDEMLDIARIWGKRIGAFVRVDFLFAEQGAIFNGINFVVAANRGVLPDADLEFGELWEQCSMDSMRVPEGAPPTIGLTEIPKNENANCQLRVVGNPWSDTNSEPEALTKQVRASSRHRIARNRMTRRFRATLSNKYIFWHLVHRHIDTPEVLARIEKSHLIPVQEKQWRQVLASSNPTVCYIKPEFGTERGQGIVISPVGMGGFWDNQGRVDNLPQVHHRWTYIVTPKVTQHSFLSEIIPETTNTLRVLAGRDREGWFLIDTILKLGTRESFPFDHFARGSISVQVDASTGRLGLGVTKGGRVFKRHPDSGVLFAGRHLPNWDSVLSMVDRLHELLPFVNYVGWDILITPNGACVIEGNSTPSLSLHQVHSPLIKTRRSLRFFEDAL